MVYIMNKAKRKTVIAGNWKMNKTPSEGVAFVKELAESFKDKNGCEIVVCVPDVDICAVAGALSEMGSQIKLGAQNAHWDIKGEYTGETSVNMLKEYGVEYVIIGHSERRKMFGETDDTVNLRLRTILAAGLKAIVCVGEREEERNVGVTCEIVSMQTKEALQEVSAEQLENVIIAYEPIWAIGTGKTPAPEEADRVNGFLRGVLAELYGKEAALSTTIQYGGSMKPNNAKELLSQENVDGGLVGGSSLYADQFAAIVEAAQ